MENLNAEQVKKWLEICAEDTPYPDQSQALLDALALINSQEQRIKELTEKNERLKATKYYPHSDGRIEVIPSVDSVRADTIKKMQERLKEVSHMTYDINSAEIEGVVYVSEIDQIAKEMLEGDNEN